MNTAIDQKRLQVKARWDAAMQAKIAAGARDLSVARQAVARESQKLRAELFSAYGGEAEEPLIVAESELLIVAFKTEITDRVKATGANRQRAMAAILREYPNLPTAVVDAVNS